LIEYGVKLLNAETNREFIETTQDILRKRKIFNENLSILELVNIMLMGKYKESYNKEQAEGS